MQDLNSLITKIDTKDLNLLSYLSASNNKLANLLPLTANENRMSDFARSYLASNFESYYYFPEVDASNGLVAKGDMYLKDLDGLRILLSDAKTFLCGASGGVDVEYRLLSGVHAMMITILAYTSPGDTICSLPIKGGGHFATQNIINTFGRKHQFLPWDDSAWDIDFGQLKRSKHFSPKMVFIDMSCPMYPINLRELRTLFPNSMIVYDASHTLGLILAGEFQSPLKEGCDILQGNTHKTFPGPQKAIALFKTSEQAQAYSKVLSSGLVSTCHSHHLAALGITCLEMKYFGRQYAKQIVLNTQSLAYHLQKNGAKLYQKTNISSLSHIILIEHVHGINAKDCAKKLLGTGSVTVNTRLYNDIPVVRIGTQTLTRLGLLESDCSELANLIVDMIIDNDNKDLVSLCNAFLKRFNTIKYSFDGLVYT